MASEEELVVTHAGSQHSMLSRVLHRLGELSSTTAATMLAALVSLLFLIAALVAPRASPWPPDSSCRDVLTRRCP